MNELIKEEANNLMNELGEKNSSLMGLTSYEEGLFDVLLWLLGGGDKPEL